MRAVLLLLAAVQLLAQSQVLSLDAEFDLAAGRPRHKAQALRCYFAATSSGLTFVSIGENAVSLHSADLKGGTLYSQSELASVHAQIYAALMRPDGSFWLVSSGPFRFSDEWAGSDLGTAAPSHRQGGAALGRTEPYNDLDLYTAKGEHLESLRLLSPAGGSESPIAAGIGQLVLRSTASRFGPAQSQLIQFGTVLNGQYKEQTRVRLQPPVLGAIPLLATNGDLLLINKTSGAMEVIDPKAKAGSLVNLAQPESVRAAAIDADYLYLLTSGAVLKTDLSRSTFHVSV